MNKNVLRFAGCLALAVTAGTAFAANYFVSASGTWSMPGITGTKTKSLKTAVSATHTAADTVWVQDGFECSMTEDAGNISGTTSGKARIKLHNSAFTLRSESGYVEEKDGKLIKGARIRGAKVSAENYDKNNVRPIWSMNAGTVIQGFVLEDGATGSSSLSGLGGAVYGPAIVSNCVIRNCQAYAGGAFGSTVANAKYVTAYNTVISNCHALAGKGTSFAYGGGAVYGAGSLYNCTLVGNTSASVGGAVSDEDYKDATPAPVYSGCVFRGNTGVLSGGLNFSEKKTKCATFAQCRITDNEATGAEGSSDVGGVSGKATMTGCVLSGNKSVNGAAALGASAGAQAYYSCLFGGNESANGKVVEGNETSPLEFYNCTVAGNSSPMASCVNGVNFHNGIIWGNTFAGDELTACTAEYSCLKNLAGTGNISEDPRLSSDYRLKKGSPCVDTAKYYDWMRAAGDARSFDAAGYPRIRCASENALKPDMGCYERECPGSLVIGR